MLEAVTLAYLVRAARLPRRESRVATRSVSWCGPWSGGLHWVVNNHFLRWDWKEPKVCNRLIVAHCLAALTENTDWLKLLLLKGIKQSALSPPLVDRWAVVLIFTVLVVQNKLFVVLNMYYLIKLSQLSKLYFFKLSSDETELISYQEFLVIVYTKTL